MDMIALLRFYLDARVNDTIGEEPVNRFNLTGQPAASVANVTPSPTATVTPLKADRNTAAVALPSLVEGVQKAQEIAEACDSIEALRIALENFEYCSLKKLASHTVFSDGVPGAKLMIVDRQPSDDEDRSGIPFSGASGQLLGKMLAAIGMARQEVYLTSVIPWRPPGGRAPTAEERALCMPFTHQHIRLAKPAYILACGEAAGYLLNQKAGINKLRGVWKDMQIGDVQAKMLPMFHPAFLIDQPASKKYAWADLLSLKAFLNQ